MFFRRFFLAFFLCFLASFGSAQTKKSLDAQFHAAVARGDLRAMESLWKKGANVNSRESDVTPIFVAVQKKRLEAAHWLISHRANLNAKSEPELFFGYADLSLPTIFQVTPLDVAVAENQAALTRLLRNAGALSGDLLEDYDENSAQIFALGAARGSLDAMRVVFESLDPKKRAPSASGAIFWATRFPDMVRLLLQNGADKKSAGFALNDAIYRGRIESARILVEGGAPLNEDYGALTALALEDWQVPDWKENSTIPSRTSDREVEEAIARGLEKRLDLLRLMLEKGADPNRVTPGGYTPFLLALETAPAKAVLLFIEHGANLNSSPAPFPAPLRFVAQNGFFRQRQRAAQQFSVPFDEASDEGAQRDLTVAQALLQHGAKIEGDNLHALAEAAGTGNAPLVQFLLAQGAPVDVNYVPRPFLFSPKHRAQTLSATEAQKQELAWSKKHIQNSQQTALHFAAGGGHVEIVKILLTAGAKANRMDALGNNALHYLAGGGRTATLPQFEVNFESNIAPNEEFAREEALTLIQNPSSISPTQGAQRIAWAAQGDSAIAKSLIQGGADPNARNKRGVSPIQMALSLSAPEVVEILLQNGAQTPRETALFAIIENGRRAFRTRPALIGLQLEFTEADRIELWSEDEKERRENARNARVRRQKALAQRAHLLKIWGETDARIAQKIIETGANPNARNAQGLTPLMLAARSGQIEMVRVLLQNGADKTAKNRANQSLIEQIQRFGSARFKTLPIRDKAQTGPLAERWMGQNALQKRENQIRQLLAREDAAMLQLLR